MALPFRLRNPFVRTSTITNENLIESIKNKFNESFFFGSLGGSVVNDDLYTKKYIDLAYNVNPSVYSVVNQIANKFTSVPYVIKKIDDKYSERKLRKLNEATNYNYSLSQEVKAAKLKNDAYSDDYMPMPLQVPNPTQTWQEFWMLSETFLCTTGNIYWYVQKPMEGLNAGVPISIYVLPSHLVEIVIKNNASFIENESPIDHYQLIEGASYVEFNPDEIIHVKYANPNYDQNGSHLYGQSPLRAAYKNIISTNKGLDLEVNTLKNGGAFGFIHAMDKQTALTVEQAQAIKSRLKEMDKSTEDLGRIAGISAAVGFTRISLTPDELKPFDYFKFDLKQVCNVLGWDDKLLNSDDGAKYDNMKVAGKRVVSGKIVPDIKLISQSFDKYFLQKFKGYEDTCINFLVKELPEMQQDYSTMVDYLVKGIDAGVITRQEARITMSMNPSDDPNTEILTVKDDVMTLEDAILPKDELSGL